MKNALLPGISLAVLFFALPLDAQSFQNGQAADAVVGKPDFTAREPTAPTATNTNTVFETFVDATSGKVFVVDFGNNRILRFASVTAAITGQPAEIAFGQPDLVSDTANNGGISSTSLDSPLGIFVDPAGRLWVADRDNNRVLRYDAATADPPGLATRTADGVIGQPNFVSAAAGTSASALQFPADVWVDSSGSLWVADFSNNRVLRFNGAANQTPPGVASVVYGQNLFTSGGGSTSQSGFAGPFGVAVDGAGHLWVADFSASRVLRFDNAQIAGSNGLGANAVLGQVNFTSSVAGDSANQLAGPINLGISSTGTLAVADRDNNRVVLYPSAASLANGAAASIVIGQPSFGSSSDGLSASALAGPNGSFFDAVGNLWISDFNNRRALRFSPIVAPPTPTPTPTPTPAPTPTPTPAPAKPTIQANGKTKLTTSKKRIVLKGRASDATEVQFKIGKGKFKRVKGSALKWKLPVRLDADRTVVQVRATGPGGTSKPVKFVVRRR